MDLKLSAAAKPEKIAVEIDRRQKLVSRIDQQIGYVRQMVDGQVPRAAWAWMDDAGRYFLPIKYGRQNLELKKGMFSVECADLDAVEHALCAVRAMAMSGELDAQITKAAEVIRANFKPK